jgi:hypothetical protein
MSGIFYALCPTPAWHGAGPAFVSVGDCFAILQPLINLTDNNRHAAEDCEHKRDVGCALRLQISLAKSTL